MNRRVSRRRRPRPRRDRFATLQQARTYALRQGWRLTTVVSTPRGDRVNAVNRSGKAITLRVKQDAHPVSSS